MMVVGCLAALVAVSCQKETSRLQHLVLSAEGMSGGQKMLVDGVSSYWSNNDKVNVNGEEYPITVVNQEATVAGEFSADNYYVVFPAEVYRGRTGEIITVDMPATYQYYWDKIPGTLTYHQVLNAPMAYSGTASDGHVKLLHLTGAINLNISGPSDIRVDRITIGTTQNRVVSGEMQFDLSNLSSIGSSATNATANNTITVDFGAEGYAMENILDGIVQVPVPVLNGDVNFTIQVEGHVEGTKYTFKRTQTTGGHIGRGVVATVAVDLNEGNANVTTSALFPTTTKNGKTYYEIHDAHDLKLMSTAIYGTTYRKNGDDYLRLWEYGGLKYKDANYLVTQDIDMFAEGSFPCVYGMAGEFNGGYHTISNITVTNCGSFVERGHARGMFTYCEATAKVCDITIDGITIETASTYGQSEYERDRVGAVVSRCSQDITISNVTVKNFAVQNYSNKWGNYYIGGFIGDRRAGAAVTITNSSISFAPNLAFCTEERDRGHIGGIFGNFDYYSDASKEADITLDNVTVDFGDMEFSGIGFYFGGISGGEYGINKVAATNVTLKVDISHTTNNSYNHFNKITPYIASWDGVDADELTITAK